MSVRYKKDAEELMLKVNMIIQLIKELPDLGVEEADYVNIIKGIMVALDAGHYGLYTDWFPNYQDDVYEVLANSGVLDIILGETPHPYILEYLEERADREPN